MLLNKGIDFFFFGGISTHPFNDANKAKYKFFYGFLYFPLRINWNWSDFLLFCFRRTILIVENILSVNVSITKQMSNLIDLGSLRIDGNNACLH